MYCISELRNPSMSPTRHPHKACLHGCSKREPVWASPPTSHRNTEMMKFFEKLYATPNGTWHVRRAMSQRLKIHFNKLYKSFEKVMQMWPNLPIFFDIGPNYKKNSIFPGLPPSKKNSGTRPDSQHCHTHLDNLMLR